MAQARAIYYLNQFFAGYGGEEKADVPLGFRQEAVGPVKRFQELCGGSLEVAVTAYCGDNYFAEHQSDVLAEIAAAAGRHDANILIAGPAFGSGRYGFACVEICHFVSTFLGISCISGMSSENPGVEIYQQYKDKGVLFVPTKHCMKVISFLFVLLSLFSSSTILSFYLLH